MSKTAGKRRVTGAWVEGPLPSGVYRGVARDPFDPRRRITSTGRAEGQPFRTWEAANAWAIARRQAMVATYEGRNVELPPTRQRREVITPTVPLFADHVIAWAKRGLPDCTLATLAGYQAQARMLAKRWPSEHVDEITDLMIEDYLAELRRQGMSASTIMLRLTVLRHAMRAAVKARYRIDDPTFGIRGPRQRQRRARIVTDAELMRLVDALPSWLAPAALTSYDAGLRIAEIAGLRRCNLDLSAGTVQVIDVIDVDGTLRGFPKSRAHRIVPLSPRLRVALEAHVERYRVGAFEPVFRNPARDGHLRTSRIRVEWNRALKCVELDDPVPTWHDLRHSCATTLARSGADPFAIKDILGHGDLKTTQNYVQRVSLERQAAAIAQAFGGGHGTELGDGPAA